MEAALRFLGTFEVDHGPSLHMSATAAVLQAKEGSAVSDVTSDVALKAMRKLDQVLALSSMTATHP
jgi:hypothetical protein